MSDLLLSRRIFMGSALVIGAGIVWSQGKIPVISKVYAAPTQIILQASRHLLPHSKVGPGTDDLNMAHYLAMVLEDERIMPSDKDYFLQGAQWLEESAYEHYSSSFLNLGHDDKEELFERIATERWGESFIYTVLGYVLEALLSAPVYGAHQDRAGWNWLEHNAGFPLPQNLEQIRYAL